MKWITRAHPKIDRIACPWLILKFIDPSAEIIFVPQELVLSKSEELNAIPFDIPGVEYTHYSDQSTFDYFLRKHHLQDPALDRIALIVRAADTDRHYLAPEAAGLWAISAGMAYNHSNDHELLKKGFVIYDALYSWARYLADSTHLKGSPFEQLLHKILSDIRKEPPAGKIPDWVNDLKRLIGEQIETQNAIGLQQLSKNLDINASYVSRAFSRYFEMNFAEYIRKLRVEKALSLLPDPTLSLTEISYLAGFSDQSHFARTFKKVVGQSPSTYRKALGKK